MRGERCYRSLETSWQRGDDAIDVGDGEQLRAGLVEPPLVRRREARDQGRHRFEIGSGKDVPLEAVSAPSAYRPRPARTVRRPVQQT